MKLARTFTTVVFLLACCVACNMSAEDAKPGVDGDTPPANTPPPAATPPAPAAPDVSSSNGGPKIPDSGIIAEYFGKLVAMPKDEIDKLGNPVVICRFERGEEKYYVSAPNDGIKAQIAAAIGHELSLKGKVIGDGKYLMVQGIIKSGPENAFVRRRGGM